MSVISPAVMVNPKSSTTADMQSPAVGKPVHAREDVLNNPYATFTIQADQ